MELINFSEKKTTTTTTKTAFCEFIEMKLENLFFLCVYSISGRIHPKDWDSHKYFFRRIKIKIKRNKKWKRIYKIQADDFDCCLKVWTCCFCWSLARGEGQMKFFYVMS